MEANENPTAAPKPSPSALRPILASAVGRPVNRACSALTFGLGLGLTAGAIRRYTLRNAPDTALIAVAQNLPLWSTLVASSSRKLTDASSLPGRAALRRLVAARLVSRLVLPAQMGLGSGHGAGSGHREIPGKPAFTARRVVSARHALAVIGCGFIKGTSLGFEGDYVNERTLAAQLGSSVTAARGNLKALEALGWLTLTKQQPGNASKFKLSPLPKKVENQGLAWYTVIELLGDQTLLEMTRAEQTGPESGHDDEVSEDLAMLLAELPDDLRSVEVLESASHAAWCYSRPAKKADRITGLAAPADLVVRDWVYLLAVSTGADPATLGLSPRECAAARKDLRLAQVGPAFEGSLMSQLDRVAARTGATDRMRAAWAVRNEAAKVRTVSAHEIQDAAGRDRRGPVRLRVVLDRVVTGMPAVPTNAASLAVLMDWVTVARSKVRVELEGDPTRTGRAKLPSWSGSADPLRAELAARFMAHGFTEAQAAKFSTAVIADGSVGLRLAA